MNHLRDEIILGNEGLLQRILIEWEERYSKELCRVRSVSADAASGASSGLSDDEIDNETKTEDDNLISFNCSDERNLVVGASSLKVKNGRIKKLRRVAYEDYLKLKARVHTELDALRELQSELEDFDGVSELQMRLEKKEAHVRHLENELEHVRSSCDARIEQNRQIWEERVQKAEIRASTALRRNGEIAKPSTPLSATLRTNGALNPFSTPNLKQQNANARSYTALTVLDNEFLSDEDEEENMFIHQTMPLIASSPRGVDVSTSTAMSFVSVDDLNILESERDALVEELGRAGDELEKMTEHCSSLQRRLEMKELKFSALQMDLAQKRMKCRSSSVEVQTVDDQETTKRLIGEPECAECAIVSTLVDVTLSSAKKTLMLEQEYVTQMACLQKRCSQLEMQLQQNNNGLSSVNDSCSPSTEHSAVTIVPSGSPLPNFTAAAAAVHSSSSDASSVSWTLSDQLDLAREMVRAELQLEFDVRESHLMERLQETSERLACVEAQMMQNLHTVLVTTDSATEMTDDINEDQGKVWKDGDDRMNWAADSSSSTSTAATASHIVELNCHSSQSPSLPAITVSGLLNLNSHESMSNEFGFAWPLDSHWQLNASEDFGVQTLPAMMKVTAVDSTDHPALNLTNELSSSSSSSCTSPPSFLSIGCQTLPTTITAFDIKSSFTAFCDAGTGTSDDFVAQFHDPVDDGRMLDDINLVIIDNDANHGRAPLVVEFSQTADDAASISDDNDGEKQDDSSVILALQESLATCQADVEDLQCLLDRQAVVHEMAMNELRAEHDELLEKRVTEECKHLEVLRSAHDKSLHDVKQRFVAQLEVTEQRFLEEFECHEQHHLDEIHQMKLAQDEHLEKMRKQITLEKEAELALLVTERDALNRRVEELENQLNSLSYCAENKSADDVVAVRNTALAAAAEQKVLRVENENAALQLANDTLYRLFSESLRTCGELDRRMREWLRECAAPDETLATSAEDAATTGKHIMNKDFCQLSSLSAAAMESSGQLSHFSLGVAHLALPRDTEEVIANSQQELLVTLQRLLTFGEEQRLAMAMTERRCSAIAELLSERELAAAKEKARAAEIELELADARAELNGDMERQEALMTRLTETEERCTQLEEALAAAVEAAQELQEAQSQLALRNVELLSAQKLLNDSCHENGQAQVFLDANRALQEENRQLVAGFERRAASAEAARLELERQVETLTGQLNGADELARLQREDLERQVSALDKQTRSQSRFLEEQTAERELERDEFHAELKRLNEQLAFAQSHLVAVTAAANANRHGGADSDSDLENDCKTFDGVFLAESDSRPASDSLNSTAREVLEERLSLAEDAALRAERNFEQQQMLCANLKESLHQAKEENNSLQLELELQLSKCAALQEQLMESSVHLDDSRSRVRVAAENQDELNADLVRMQILQEELLNDKEELRRQVCTQLEQLSILRGELDAKRLSNPEFSNVDGKFVALSETLDQERESRILAEEQVERLECRLEETERTLRQKSLEIAHLDEELQARFAEDAATAAATANNHSCIDEVNLLNKRLRKEVRDLKFHREDVASQTSPITGEGLSEFTERLLAEKDAELNALQATLARFHFDSAEAATLRTEILEIREADKETRSKQQLRYELEQTRAELISALEQLREGRTALSDIRKSNGCISVAIDAQDDLLQLLLINSNTDEANSTSEVALLEEVLEETRDQLAEQELTLRQNALTIATLRDETSSLNNFQMQLQEDYDEIQSMLEERQAEVETLQLQLDEANVEIANASHLQDEEVAMLRGQLEKITSATDEREEDLYVAQEKIELLEKRVADLQEELHHNNSRVQNTTEEEKMSNGFEESYEKRIENLHHDLKEALIRASKAEMTIATQETAAQNMETTHSATMEQMQNILARTRAELNDALSRQEACVGENEESTVAKAALEAVMLQLEDERKRTACLEEQLNAQLRHQFTLSNETMAQDEVSSSLQTLLRRVHEEGLKLLSLSELQLVLSTQQQQLQNDAAKAFTQHAPLQGQINILKSLLKHLEPSSYDTSAQDWRSCVLEAVQGFLAEERALSLPEIRRLLTSTMKSSNYSNDVVDRLDIHLREFEKGQRLALDRVLLADRQSLMDEISSLRRSASRTEMELRHEKERWQESESQAYTHSVDMAACQRRVQMLESLLAATERRTEESTREAARCAKELRQCELAAREKSTQLETELMDVRRQLAHQEEQFETESNRARSLTVNVHDLLNVIEEERNNAASLRRELTDETKRSTQLQTQLFNMMRHESAELEQLRTKVAEMRDKMLAAEEEAARARAIEQRCESESTAAAQLRETLDQLQLRHGELRMSSRALENKCHALQDQLSKLTHWRRRDDSSSSSSVALQKQQQQDQEMEEDVAIQVNAAHHNGNALSDAGSECHEQALAQLVELLSNCLVTTADAELQLDATTRELPMDLRPTSLNLTAQILQRNAHLMDLVATSTDEKAELRRTLAHVEEELSHYRRRKLSTHDQQQQLPTSSSEMARAQLVYGKYLRAESYRRSLVYQKRYLLLLLGGFRDSEDQILLLISQVNGAAATSRSTSLPQSQLQLHRPLYRFRSVARALVAIHRMRLLVHKWRRALRIGAPFVSISTPQMAVPSSSSPSLYRSPNSSASRSYLLDESRREAGSPSLNSLEKRFDISRRSILHDALSSADAASRSVMTHHIIVPRSELSKRLQLQDRFSPTTSATGVATAHRFRRASDCSSPLFHSRSSVGGGGHQAYLSPHQVRH